MGNQTGTEVGEGEGGKGEGSECLGRGSGSDEK